MNGGDVLLILLDLTLGNLPTVAADVMLVVGCIVIACRIEKMMRGVTALRVFLQHAALALGMFNAFLLSFTKFAAWGTASVAAGVLIFFLLSLSRWRYAPPSGTERARPLSPKHMRNVAGGRGTDP